MARKKPNTLTIIIGGDIESNYNELLSGKSIKKIKQPKNILYLKSYKQLTKLITASQMDLLRYLTKNQTTEEPLTITEIADATNRKQSAISRDIKYLSQKGLVILKQVKQMVYAYSPYTSTQIIIK